MVRKLTVPVTLRCSSNSRHNLLPGFVNYTPAYTLDRAGPVSHYVKHKAATH